MTIRRVPRSLNTTGKVGILNIGYRPLRSSWESTILLFWGGITRFLWKKNTNVKYNKVVNKKFVWILSLKKNI